MFLRLVRLHDRRDPHFSRKFAREKRGNHRGWLSLYCIHGYFFGRDSGGTNPAMR